MLHGRTISVANRKQRMWGWLIGATDVTRMTHTADFGRIENKAPAVPIQAAHGAACDIRLLEIVVDCVLLVTGRAVLCLGKV
jgi:hypothetical protein